MAFTAVTRWCGLTLALVAAVGVGCGGAGDDRYEMPSEAMEPTFDGGESLDVDRDAYDDDGPAIGDVIVFHPPTGAESGDCGSRPGPGQACSRPTPTASSDIEFVKRVVAGPGDRVRIKGGAAVVNDEAETGDYLRPCHGGACDLPREIVVADTHYFVLGDNRGASDDSRQWGPVRTEWITGKVLNAE